MAQVKCFHCKAIWDLASATTNRCPKCGWITEIFFDKKEAERVKKLYNNLQPPPSAPSGVSPLVGIEGFSVSFPGQSRLAEVASQFIGVKGSLSRDIQILRDLQADGIKLACTVTAAAHIVTSAYGQRCGRIRVDENHRILTSVREDSTWPQAR